MSDDGELESFRAEARGWLEANFPPSLKGRSARGQADTTAEEWQADLRDITERLTESCRAVDPPTTFFIRTSSCVEVKSYHHPRPRAIRGDHTEGGSPCQRHVKGSPFSGEVRPP